MTIFEASMKLYGWFSEHHSFCLDVDEGKLLEGAKRKKYERQEEKAAIKCALLDLEKLEMVSPATIDDKEVWVLRRDFSSLEQTIKLAPETCQSIAHIVNGFCDVLHLTGEDRVNPMEVGEKDIKNLAFVCAHLMDGNKTGEE